MDRERMQGIIFEYDPIRSKQRRQFTVRLSDRKKENHKWIKQGRSRVYTASDLPEIAPRVLDTELFRIALENEIAIRKTEARFFSREDEYTLLRISEKDMREFIVRCQKKQILCDAGGSILTFDFMSGLFLEIHANRKNRGYLLKVLLWDIELSRVDYLIRSPKIIGFYENRILSVHPDVPSTIMTSLPLGKEITETEFEKVQQSLSKYGDRILFKIQGTDQKKTRLKSTCRPVLNLDSSLRYAELCFWYDNKIMVKSKDTREVIYDALQGVELQRNAAEEGIHHDFLKHIGVQYPQSIRGDWYLPPRKLDDILQQLVEKKFMLQINHEPLYVGLHNSWRLETKDHELFLTGELTGKTGSAGSGDLFNSYGERRRTIQLSDGSYGFLSSSLMEELRLFAGKGVVQNNGIVFRDVDFPIVLDLIRNKENINLDEESAEWYHPEGDPEQLKAHPIPESLKEVLRPYQIFGFYWLMWLNQSAFNGILADDMGLGKTLQVLTLLLHLKSNHLSGPSLLIVPKTLIHNWEIEIQKFAPSLSYRIYSGSNRVRDPAGFAGADLVITSYGLVRMDEEIFRIPAWDYIILDEAQAIKNPNAKTTRAVKKIRSKYRLSLSGTPVENSPLDLWSHFDFLMPGMLGKMSEFKQHYGQQHPEDLRELNLRTHPFILRRLKGQVCRELPSKTEITLYCDFTDHQEQVYKDVLAFAQDEIRERLKSDIPLTLHVLTLLLRLRQVACDPTLLTPEKNLPFPSSGKQEMVLNTARTILSGGYKILIFSQFVEHLKLMEKRFEERGIDRFYLDGATKDRKGEIERFQQCKTPCVFFISIKTGGLGLNLTEANYAFLLDPWWNPAVENQAIDRCYRIGQENPVTVYRFITQNSIEERVMALKDRKRDIQQQIISESDMEQVPFTEDRLVQLLLDEGN